MICDPKFENPPVLISLLELTTDFYDFEAGAAGPLFWEAYEAGTFYT